MEFLFLLLAGAVAWFLYSKAKEESGPGGKTKHCMTCGIDTNPKSTTKGSIFIEIILWLCFLIPGVIYSIWRTTTRTKVCPSCGGTTMVPSDSPAAIAHKKQLQA